MKNIVLLISIILLSSCGQKNLDGIYFGAKTPIFIKIEKNKLKMTTAYDSIMKNYTITRNSISSTENRSFGVENKYNYRLDGDTLLLINPNDTLKMIKQTAPIIIDNDEAAYVNDEKKILLHYKTNNTILPYILKNNDTIPS